MENAKWGFTKGGRRMRWEIKRIRKLEKALRSNGDADFQDEYLFLHAKLHRPLPKDFIIEDDWG
jgi:hypothetical protein